jgi:hypothetical protein
MANRIQLRRGGAQEWANANPTLAQGELGIELDTGRFKIGDGATAWNTLRYERPVESNTNTPNTLVQRDADGSFSAGTITSTLIGNASTSTRLEQTRQIQLSNDVTATGNFDGSQNLNLSTALSLINTLPHYLEGGLSTTTRTFTEVTVDQKGRVINARTPAQLNLTDYGLDGSATSDTTLAQPWNANLEAISDETGTGLYSKTAAGVVETRLITGAAGQIVITDGGGISGNPLISLSIQANVVPGDYNTESLTSVSQAGGNGEPFGTETVNASKFSVDDKGRLTTVTNVPIATATEGSKYANYDAGTAYSRYAIIQNASKVYQAIADIGAGVGAPTHSSGDTGSWRYLAAEATEQKGLASFAQEDFDVDSNGHVTIAAVGVDNLQLQNNRVSFADGNTKEDFELDQELTATTGYRGFNYLNYLKVNDTSGNLLVGANNTGDSGAGELDVNVRTYFSDPNIDFDGAVDQIVSKYGDGHWTVSHVQDTATPRNLNILAANSGSGSANIIITADDTVQINASDAAGKVHVEDYRFQTNYLGTTDATMHLDPGDDRAVTGLVRIHGNLQIDGTTTTVNSTQLTVDDVTILLGGDTVPTTDDNLDRGIEFNYYDTEARLGFYGWDTNYSDLAAHAGGYRFLHAATNTNEVFTGTDSGIIAGNLKLTTNTNSTSNTTGDLVVAGGVGITQDVNIGGLVDIDSTLRVHSTSRFDDNMVIQGASKTLQLNNGSGTTKIELQSTTGNGSLAGILDVTGNLNVNTDKFNVVAASGNTTIAGTLGVTDVATFTNDIDANANMTLSGDLHMESTNDIDIAKNAGTGVWEIQNNDYGALRLDGGMYAAGDALIDGTLHVNGAIEVKDSATEAESRLNWLRVRYRGRFGDSYQATPSYASHNTTTLRAHGGAGVERTFHVGGTGTGEGLFVGKRYSGDTVKFSVLGASGNTEIQGTLLVEDNVNFNGTLDVDADFAVRNGTTDKFFVDNVTGNTDIQGTLDVNGATEITNTLDVSNAVTFDQTLLVQGNSEFNGTVDVDANFAVRSGSTDKMTVASSSGNIATDGTLVVQGQTTINDSLIVDAANELFSVRNGSAVAKFEVDTDNGNTNIIGTLTVGDATQINDTLGASGIVTLTNNTEQTLTGSYGADGALRLTGGAAVQRNLAVGGAARIYGNTELTGTLDLNNSADISGALVTHDDVTITADNKTFAIQNASAANKFTVDTDNGNTDIRGTLDIGGDVTAESNLTVTGNLTINGTTTTVNSTVTTIDDPIITVGGDTAPASNDGKDRGVEFRYYDSSAKVGFFGYDRSANQFAFVVDATNSSEVLSGTDGQLRAGSLNLTGSGTSLDVDANANIDGTLTVDGQIISQVSSGAALVIPNTTKINNLNADLLDSMTTASAATATTVVARDSNADFAANQITVNNGIGSVAGIQGNATSADALRTARTITVDGVVDGSVSFDGSANVTISTTYNDADITALAAMAGTGFVSRTAANTYAQRTLAVTASSGITLTNADGVAGNPTINVASTASNSANNLVLRDASGNFAAGIITAALVGNVTGQVSDISNHDTGDLSEGSNLYFTNERVDDRVNALIVAGTGITKAYNDSAGTYTLTVTQVDIDTDNVTEGSTNLFTTAARTRTHFTYGTGIELSGAGALSVTQADINTDNVTEGSTNIFYTEARFDASLAGKNTANLAEGTNLYYTDARADARIAAADTDDLSEGSTNLYYTNSRADARVNLQTGANLDLSSKSTTNLSEGTNQYYTEARVQTKLDNAFEQLSAMLNNLATATTLTLNLSGDPTPGDVTALNNGTLSGGTLYNTGTAVATTSSGSGTGLTVDITASGGAITAVAINAAGSGYVVGETITISTGGGDATINVSAVTEMAIGDTVTGSTSGTTGVITAVGATSVTVDTVDGFFKKTETVSAGDVSTLTITSFA